MSLVSTREVDRSPEPHGEQRGQDPAPRRWARAVARLTVVGVTTVFVLALVPRVWSTNLASSIVGTRALAVTSDSMSPTFSSGDLVLVEHATPARIASAAPGDIITFAGNESSNGLITHRIVRIIRSTDTPAFVTKGDANAATDTNPVAADRVVGIYRARIPMGARLSVGLVRVPLLLLVVALLLSLAALGRGKGRLRITRSGRMAGPTNNKRKGMGK